MKKIILTYVIIIVLIFTSCNSVQNNNSDNCEHDESKVEWYDKLVISDPLFQEESFIKENMENIEYVVEGVKYMMKYIKTRKNIFTGEIDVYQCYDCSEIAEENLKHVYMDFKNNTLVYFYGYEEDVQEEASITEEQAIEKAKNLLKTENVCIDDYVLTVKKASGYYDISFMSANVPDGFDARFIDDSAFVRVSFLGKIFRFELPINQNELKKYNLSFDTEEILQKSEQRVAEVLEYRGNGENIIVVECTDHEEIIGLGYSDDLGPCLKKYLYVYFTVDGKKKGQYVSVCIPIEQ